MVIKRKDFQKAAAFIHEFLLKLNEDVECAEVRDTLNLALLHMQKYYRLIQTRSQEKCVNTLSLTARGLSPMTPFVDAPDKFLWRWINLDNARLTSSMPLGDSLSFVVLPPFISAVKEGNIELVNDLLRQDPGSADSVDGLGRTGVVYSVHFFQHDVLKFLLDQRCDINAQAHDGSTAIHRACHDANHIALSLLVDYGGDFTICDVQGRAPIHWAVTTRSTECLEILLSNKAYAGTRDKDGLTPSMWACRMDNIKHFEMLCHAENNHIEEADGIERDATGRTWMHWSVRRSQPLECLQTLLTPDSAAIKDDEGKTVILLAAEMGSLHACRLIIEIAGPRCCNDQDHQGRTSLHLATMGGHGDVVNYLLDKGADVTVVDSFNATAWDYARIRKLHYCQLIIMSHQRQRMSSNPASPLPNGFGLLLKEESGMQDDFSRMSFRTRSNLSTPITPPHPPKRPRSSRMLARRANSLTSSDRDRDHDWRAESVQSEDRLSMSSEMNGGPTSRKKERISVNVNTTSKRAAGGESFMSRETTSMTDASRPIFEDENDEISEGGMDVSDIECEDQMNAHAQRGAGGGGKPGSRNSVTSQPTPRPRPPPRGRPQRGQPPPPHAVQNGMGDYNMMNGKPPSSNNYAHNNSNNNYSLQTQSMEFEDAAAGPSPRAFTDSRHHSPPSGRQVQSQGRPQARVPPTPMHRSPPRGGPPVPSPPSTTPQRPHMLRQQQPLPSSSSVNNSSRNPQQPQPPPLQRELTPPSAREASPPVSSHSSDQLSAKAQGGSGGGDRPNSGSNQAPGVIVEGRKIPPPALTPLYNAPKPPTMDSFDRMDGTGKKKKKKKKDKDGSRGNGGIGSVGGGGGGVKSPPPKPENPSDIKPPRGFAAPLHPHQQVPGRISSAVPPAPRLSKGIPQVSESRYVDENVEDDGQPPVVSGFAVPIRGGSSKPNTRSRAGGLTASMESYEEEGAGGEYSSSSHSHPADAEGMDGATHQSPIEEVDEEDVGPLIPPPPSFRGATRGGNKPLAQSIPQDNRSARMIPTSAKPPLPKNRSSVSSQSPRHNPRPPGKSATPGRKPRPPTSRSTSGT